MITERGDGAAVMLSETGHTSTGPHAGARGSPGRHCPPVVGIRFCLGKPCGSFLTGTARDYFPVNAGSASWAGRHAEVPAFDDCQRAFELDGPNWT